MRGKTSKRGNNGRSWQMGGAYIRGDDKMQHREPIEHNVESFNYSNKGYYAKNC